MRPVTAARAFFLLSACAVGTLASAGCAESGARGEGARRPSNASTAHEPGPPNAAMLDYMSPEEIARSRAEEAQRAPPVPPPGTTGATGATGAPEPPPRIRQTIVIGRNNPDPVWETDGPGPAAYEDHAPPSGGFALDHPTTYRGGRSFYYGGSGGGGSQAAAPRVGGDWPTVPTYGPKQMR